MKRLALILSLFALVAGATELPVTTNAVFNRFASSYYTSHRAGDYADAGKYLYWNKLNIQCYDASRSGGSLQDVIEDRLERRGFPTWANGGTNLWGVVPVDDNGEFTSNTTYLDLAQIFKAPTNVWNGTSFTNEGGWGAAHPVNWLPFGSIPQPGLYLGGDAQKFRDDAVTNTAGLCFKAVPLYDQLAQRGWSNDIASGANLIRWEGTDGKHPGPPGNLDMAIVECEAMMDTNINTCVIDGGAGALRSTNHCVVSGLLLSNGTLSFNWLADRHSLVWDHPDGTITNNATDGLKILANGSNAFCEVMDFTNLPAASYDVYQDSEYIGTFPVVNGRLSINWFSITRGALWRFRVNVLRLVRIQRYCDPVTLVDGSAGDGKGEVSLNSQSTAKWNSGFRGDALISQLSGIMGGLTANIDDIHTAAVPVQRSFALVPTAIVNTGTLSAGTVHWGQ